jgi:hypothetical protein
MRKILLLEPKYRNKYPPIGLMKIATYHRLIGDEVTFYKGDVKEFVLDTIITKCLAKLALVEPEKNWQEFKLEIRQFIKTRRKKILLQIRPEQDLFNPLAEEWLRYYADYYRKKKYENEPEWDRVYVTSLFTFYWSMTVDTINHAKYLVKDLSELRIGGVMASLLTKEIEEETGIKPFKGLLDKPGMLGDDNNLIVDDLPLDYSILDEIDYQYPTGSAYFTFMTKGCTRKCAFCSVPILEPTYKPKIDTIDKFQEIKERYGEQQHLLLMDNNVLASPKFLEIIDEIKEMGFYKGATFIEPNQYEIGITNLKKGWNEKGTSRRIFNLLHELLSKRLKKKPIAHEFYEILDRYSLLDFDSVTVDGLLASYNDISPIFEKYRDKSPKARYVDFNQGTDARYVTDELMAKMSEIPIRPLRIAFDYIGMKKQYTNAVRLAAKHGIDELSNYLLYNFKDKPADLYNRMLINIDLAQELDVKIFSFPMKYIPLFGEDAKHRNYIGKHWNRKYIRAIQSILNVTKGIVASGRDFFYKAFGRDEAEFEEILYMPETYIVYRKVFEEAQLTNRWRDEFNKVRGSEDWQIAQSIIHENAFKSINMESVPERLRPLLTHYIITRDDLESQDQELDMLKKEYSRLIKKDKFIDLTLTYDFE